jgi:chromosome segregation ATPase
MNKKILALSLSIVMLLPAGVFAKGNGNSSSHGNGKEKAIIHQKQSQSEDKKLNNDSDTVSNEKNTSAQKNDDKKKNGEEHKQEAKQNKDDKKQQIDSFKTQMKDKHQQMKQIDQQAKSIRLQIEQKKDNLSAILADLQSGRKTLPEDMLNSLLSLSQSLKDDGTKLKETSEINNEVSDTQKKVDSEDFNNAICSMDKVISKMHARLDALNKLNTDLDAALKIANLATTPAAEPGTTTPSAITTSSAIK